MALIGFMEIINGAMRIQTAFDARRFGISRWWIMLAVAVLSVGIGGFLLFNPIKSSETILVIVGVSLLISGILHVITALITVKKRPKKKDTASVYEADYRDL